MSRDTSFLLAFLPPSLPQPPPPHNHHHQPSPQKPGCHLVFPFRRGFAKKTHTNVSHRRGAEDAEFSRREKAAEFTTEWLMTQRGKAPERVTQNGGDSMVYDVGEVGVKEIASNPF